MPKVSVIIPIYNVEKYLKEYFESVINSSKQKIFTPKRKGNK